MIRAALMKSVYDVLSSHAYLALEDFTVVEYKNKNTEPCLSIAYRYDETWYFRFHIPQKKTANGSSTSEYYYFNCSINPGRESAEETLEARSREGLINEIGEWLKRLYEDIVSAPVVRRFDAHSTALEQLRERLSQLPEEPLSAEDVVEFRNGLEAIKAEFTEQLKAETADKEELKQRVEQLTRDIDFLKQSLEAMSKRQWSEVFVVRVQKWKEKLSLKQLTTGARVLRKLIPANVSPELDAVANVVDEVVDAIDPK